MRAVGLDHDGVTVPGRHLLLPLPRELERAYAAKEITYREYCHRMPFDQAAVFLLNRLCEKADTKIFVISHWRSQFTAEEMVAKYIAEGIDERFLHSDLHAQVSRQPKDVDVARWLDKNRINPAPDRKTAPPGLYHDDEPGKYPDRATWQAAHEEYLAAYRDHGIDFLLLDDDPDDVQNYDRHLPVDYNRGFDHEAYRIAAGFFGVVDEKFGVYPVSADDLNLARTAHKNRRMEALAFLHGRARMTFTSDVHTNARGLAEGQRDPNPLAASYGDSAKSRLTYAERIRDGLRTKVAMIAAGEALSHTVGDEPCGSPFS